MLARLLVVMTVTASACARDSSCAACTIALEPLVEFEFATDGDAAIASYPQVSPLIGGRYYVLTEGNGAAAELARLYDANGRFLRMIGSFGSGPTEFRWPEFAYASGDSALIWDQQARRMTVFVPPDSFVRTISWRARPFTFAQLADGTFAVTEGSFRVGRHIQHVGRDGRVLTRFGDSLSTPRDEATTHLIAAGADGSIWTAPWIGRLRLSHWSSPGVLREIVDYPAGWNQQEETYASATPERPPRQRLAGLWADSANTVWMVVSVPDPEWHKGLGEPQHREGHEPYYPVVNPARVFDTIIEQWDPVSRRILQTQRLDRAAGIVTEPGVLLFTTSDADGWQRVRLERIVVR